MWAGARIPGYRLAYSVPLYPVVLKDQPTDTLPNPFVACIGEGITPNLQLAPLACPARVIGPVVLSHEGKPEA